MSVELSLMVEPCSLHPQKITKDRQSLINASSVIDTSDWVLFVYFINIPTIKVPTLLHHDKKFSCRFLLFWF